MADYLETLYLDSNEMKGLYFQINDRLRKAYDISKELEEIAAMESVLDNNMTFATYSSGDKLSSPYKGSDSDYLVMDCYGPRSNSRYHDGIDLSHLKNTQAPLYALADGIVVVSKAPSGSDPISYLVMWHPHLPCFGGGPGSIAYLHATNLPAAGTKIRRGDKVGNQGDLGSTGAFHLHMEVWMGPQGVHNRIDPAVCLSLTKTNIDRDLSFKRSKQHLKARSKNPGY